MTYAVILYFLFFVYFKTRVHNTRVRFTGKIENPRICIKYRRRIEECRWFECITWSYFLPIYNVEITFAIVTSIYSKFKNY